MMDRRAMIEKLQSCESRFDVAVIGGGATGLGIAVDAATRGYRVALFEQNDFAKGTSSRSTKLVHGGVRYLEKGDVALVLEALYERGLMARNAPHLFKNQKFLIPCYRWYEGAMYTVGLTLYDLLAGRLSLGRSAFRSKSKSASLIPPIKQKGLRCGVIYHDGQFDDSRLAIHLAATATKAGACVLNYFKVTALLKENGKVVGVKVNDEIDHLQYEIKAPIVINATGVFADEITQLDTPNHPLAIKPSQGVHVVLDASFLQGDTALMIPKTSDGRVLFAVPWHGSIVVGTTDTVVNHPSLEPKALEEEINFILTTAGNYLTKKPSRSDVRSVFAGLRPLAAPKGEGKKTKEISRSHKITREPSGLISIIGGKWTTYRKMAEDTINFALRHAPLTKRPCVTKEYHIHGYKLFPNYNDHFYVYGSDAALIKDISKENGSMNQPLHPDLPYTEAEVRWFVRSEMAQTVEDVLARRFRALFLHAKASVEMAPRVAAIMAEELRKDEAWIKQQTEEFMEIAINYIIEVEKSQLPFEKKKN